MIRFSLRRTFAMLYKEFIQLKRDKMTLRMIIAIPVLQLIMFGYALNTNPKHLPTAVLSKDNSSISLALLSGLKNTGYFSINYTVRSNKQAHALLRRGKVLFVITIPNNFKHNLIRGTRPQILIEADGSDPVAISGAINAVEGMLNTIFAEEFKGALSYLQKAPPPIDIRIHKLYNPEGFTHYNIIPGLIAIILTMTGIMMTSLSMTRERECGTMENLLVMPVSPLEVMVGKITPYVLVGFFQAILIIVFAKALFDVPVVGNLGLLFLAFVLFITCNMGVGFTVSTVAKNQTQALQMSFMVMLTSILFSGFLFPFLGMPLWARVIGNILPTTYFIRISRGILLKGSNFAEILPSLYPQFIFIVVIILVATLLYRKTLD